MSLPSPNSTVTSATTSTDSSRAPSTGCYVPMLTESNYQMWQWAIKATCRLTTMFELSSVSRPPRGLVDPKPPTDAPELERWHQSERMALGIIAGTIIDIHLELLHKSAWRAKGIERSDVGQSCHNLFSDKSLMGLLWQKSCTKTFPPSIATSDIGLLTRIHPRYKCKWK